MSNVFLDGQQNLAALTVPGVYSDIILPTPMLLGTPTNIMGLVGVGSWGPLNSLIPLSKPADAAVNIGPPLVRNYDISSYVSAASQVGGAIGFYAVRVSDGTDTAATVTIQSALTLTAKYTGSLGNQITVSFQNGSAVSSYMAVVSFPGMVPEQFNNITQGVMNFSVTPGTYTVCPTALTITAPQTATIAGLSSQTAVAVPSLAVQGVPTVSAGGSSYAVNDTITLSNGVIVKVLTVTSGAVATISVLNAGSVAAGATAPTNPVAQVSSSGTGTGATFTLVWGLAQPTITNNGTGYTSAPTVTVVGGTGSGGTMTATISYWPNVANAINNGSPQRGASQFVIATSLTSAVTPTVSTVYTMTGGTDGAAGATDTTLMGVDTVPRKGMYVLRNSRCDSFTLCDMSTSANYAAVSSFALAETMLAVFATTKGDTISGATTTRINAAADTPWLWLIMGDWPTFYDSYNGLSRLINPSAFGIGILGNLSPQQSPLNKPLQGISATQRTQLGQTYSDTELSLVNTGGIDTIIGPTQSPGGYYFSFASGRNTSSNTAANGIEYTRMTNFLIRASQSKAAGSFIGRLQSIQPNDQTRAQAKALFDGFSAQLADPAVGLGIGGQGIIDRPWSVVCDLTNNPPNLQALGYLFLYWQVRYLNVVRFFVVKFAGGGNVSVSVQSTVPSPSQFTQAANSNV